MKENGVSDETAQEGKPLLIYLQEAEEKGVRGFCEQYGIGFRVERE